VASKSNQLVDRLTAERCRQRSEADCIRLFGQLLPLSVHLRKSQATGAQISKLGCPVLSTFTFTLPSA